MRSLIVAGLVATVLLNACGCGTVVGSVVGSVVDIHGPHGHVPPADWDQIEPGTRIQIVKQDGTTESATTYGDSLFFYESGDQVGWVPIREIARVEIPKGSKGKRIGRTIGILFDVVMLVVILTADIDMS